METATILLDNGCPIHLTTKRYKVDAKSLIGIFGMDLTKPLTVEIGTPNHQVEREQIDAVLQDLEEFAVSAAL